MEIKSLIRRFTPEKQEENLLSPEQINEGFKRVAERLDNFMIDSNAQNTGIHTLARNIANLNFEFPASVDYIENKISALFKNDVSKPDDATVAKYVTIIMNSIHESVQDHTSQAIQPHELGR